MNEFLLKGGYVVDPVSGLNCKKDILIEKGIITAIENEIKSLDCEILNANNCIIMPGFFDLHSHLRTPGREDTENLYSGAKAALKGGYVNICCMPNTTPAIDNSSAVKFIIEKSREDALINIFPIAAITKNREGIEITEMADLKENGAVGFSDDGKSVLNSEVMRRAMEYSKITGLPVISHCEDPYLSEGGQINEGALSSRLGLKGIPREAEILIVFRDIMLCKLTGAKLHIAHVSCKETVDLIKKAKKEGINVTAEVCPHHIYFTEEETENFNCLAKVNPPLRTKKDVKALIDGLCNGTIDIIATDHAPHAEQEKDLEFDNAAFGMIGLETALPACAEILVKSKKISWMKLAELMSLNPALIAGKTPCPIEVSRQANLSVIKKENKVIDGKFYSLSKNSLFTGKKLYGVVNYVFSKGNLRIKEGNFVES